MHPARAALEANQLRKFRHLVAHAIRHSAYYADLVKERGIDPAACAPADFPVLTKEILARDFDRIVCTPRLTKQRIEDFLAQSRDPRDLLDGRYVIITSSGTSGQNTVCACSKTEMAFGVGRIRNEIDSKLPPHRPIRLAYIGATNGHIGGITIASSIKRDDAEGRFHLLPLDINAPWRDIVNALNDYQPHFVAGDSTALRELADRQKSGAAAIAPALIQCGGEPLTLQDRAAIEGAFAIPVLNIYATSECFYMGVGWHHDRMTLLEDALIFELREDHTLVTNLFNYTTPLIRYRFNDVLVTSEGNASSPYTVIKELVGRTESNLRLENDQGEDETISVHALLVLHVPGIQRLQCVVKGKRSLTLKARCEDGLDAAETARARNQLTQEFRAILTGKRCSGVAFDVEDCPDLRADPKTGKFRMVCVA